MIETSSLRELADQVLADIESKTNQNTPPVAVAYNRIVANAVAALHLSAQLHNVDQRKECFPQTASENIGLSLWADIVNRPRGSGVQATLQALATGTNGIVIGTGTVGPRWQSDGLQFSTITGGTISGGAAEIEVQCSIAGTIGTLQIGDEIALTTTIAGIDSIATITAINIPGEDQEEVEDWRSAIIQLAAFPPNIGTAAWFYNEAISIDGITRAYPYSSQSYPGQVIIYAVADGNTDGIPSAAQLEDVASIASEANKNVLWAYETLPNSEARLVALASPVDLYYVTITEGTPPLSASMKEAIEAAIDNYFLTRNPYIQGLFLEDQGSVEAVGISSTIQNTIESQVGDTGRITDVTLQKEGELAAEIYTLEVGHRAKPSISYT